MADRIQPGASTRLLGLTRTFVERSLAPWPEFRAALVVGSVAHGEARENSDVDCVFVFDHVDERVVPAEFVWCPADDAYHTIFEVDATETVGVQIGARRVSMEQLVSEEWEEGLKHELASAVALCDRDGAVAAVLARRLTYPPSLRVGRVLELYLRAEHLSEAWRVRAWAAHGGLACAHDQIAVAFLETVQLLHAYNRTWLPYRYRWLISARKLRWVPNAFDVVEAIVTEVAPTVESLLRRQSAIVRLLEAIARQLKTEALLDNPGDAFEATHPTLGHAHNMAAWREAHQSLLLARGEPQA